MAVRIFIITIITVAEIKNYVRARGASFNQVTLCLSNLLLVKNHLAFETFTLFLPNSRLLLFGQSNRRQTFFSQQRSEL